MEIRLLASNGFNFSTSGDEEMEAYIRKVYNKYGSNVLHQNIVLSGSGDKIYVYHTVKISNNID